MTAAEKSEYSKLLGVIANPQTSEKAELIARRRIVAIVEADSHRLWKKIPAKNLPDVLGIGLCSTVVRMQMQHIERLKHL